MEWLFILLLVLAAWIWRQSARIGVLEQQLDQLRSQALAQRTPATRGAEAPRAPTQAPTDDTQEPLILDTPLPPLFFAERESDHREPLLLDTPLPVASNDEAQPAVATRPILDDREIVVRAVAPTSPATLARSSTFAQWLSENGLAWLGGGALALGVILFLSFAAKQNWFTPTVQLSTAVGGGIALLIVSEIVRRQSYLLVAALLAATGALAFYATSWAMYGGYHFITWPIAALLLTACAFVLFVLALLHGETLGVLAIVAAMLTPAIAGARAWPDAAIALYVSTVALSGFGLAWIRRWSWTATIALLGLYFWFSGAIAVDELNRAMVLLSVASVGALTLALGPSTNVDEDGPLPWSRVATVGPTVAICMSSVFMLWVWASVSLWRSGSIAAPTFIGVLHVALAGYAVRLRKLSPAAFTVTAGALVAGVALYLVTRIPLAPLGADVYASMLAASVVTALSALGARGRGASGRTIAGSGALGTALLTVLAATTRPNWHELSAWAPLLAGATLLFLCAWRAARSAPNERADWRVNAWFGSGAALLLLAVESAWAPTMRATGDGAAALLIASAVWWRGWRMARFAALAAAAISVAHAISPDLISATLSAALPLWQTLLVLATAAALLLASSLMVRQREPGPTSEALSSASIMLVIAGLFLTLRWLTAGAHPAALDALSEHGLRALVLLTAGYLVLPRGDRELGQIARVRGHVLLGGGLLYTLIEPVLLGNPWWGAWPASVSGPLPLDTLLLAFAAPAAVAFAAANRLYRRQRDAARIYVLIGGLLALLWALLAVRRAFHPIDMSIGNVGVFEAACHALLLIAFALAIALGARLREGPNRPFAMDLQSITRLVTWSCLLIATWIMLVARSPWWGPHAPSSEISRIAATVAQAWAATLSIALGRALSRTQAVDPTRFAAASAAALFTWSFGHAVIQLAPFDGLAGFAHALWPLLMVVAGAAITARVPGRNTVRAYLKDLDAIWATAVWPALGFAAFALWIISNPWWGLAPARSDARFLLLGLASYPLAAWLGLLAAKLPRVRWRSRLEYAASFAAVMHAFVAMTLVVRFFFHGAAMTKANAEPLEMWIYSALWAVYGGGLVALGTLRKAPVLVWSGLALLAITAVKVFVFDTAQLSGLIRAGSAVGLGIVALTVAWATQRINRAPHPGELLKTIPPRRDLRDVRSRRRR